MSCVLCESYTVQNEFGSCLVHCVSRILFRMSLAHVPCFCESYTVQNEPDSYLVFCVRRILFRMSLAHVLCFV